MPLRVVDVADHYRSIGFPVPDALTLVQLLRRTVLEGGRTSQADGFHLVRWHDDASGARINVVLNTDGVIRSAKPSFLPAVSRPVRARVHGLHPDSSNPDAHLVKITVANADLPWSVEFEDGAAAVAGLCFGEETDLEVVGFAGRLDCYEDEGSFAASGIPLGTREMLPAGIHALGRDRDIAGQRMSALASGVVMEVEELHNALGGESFLHLVIDTTPVPLDVVVSPHEVHGPPPRRGHVVTGSLWLVARQIAPSAAPLQVPAIERVAGDPGPARPFSAVTGARTHGHGPRGPRLFSGWALNNGR